MMLRAWLATTGHGQAIACRDRDGSHSYSKPLLCCDQQFGRPRSTRYVVLRRSYRSWIDQRRVVSSDDPCIAACLQRRR